MSDQYLGEIRLFAGSFAPVGWLMCNGQLLPISENDALFALIGTTYGGDGVRTFALPDLRGRVAMSAGRARTGTSYVLGQAAGTETVTLLTTQIPAHTHAPLASTAPATARAPANNVWAATNTAQYSTAVPNTPLSPQAVIPNTGNQPHENMMPFVAMSYIIATEGIFPSQG